MFCTTLPKYCEFHRYTIILLERMVSFRNFLSVYQNSTKFLLNAIGQSTFQKGEITNLLVKYGTNNSNIKNSINYQLLNY